MLDSVLTPVPVSTTSLWLDKTKSARRSSSAWLSGGVGRSVPPGTFPPRDGGTRRFPHMPGQSDAHRWWGSHKQRLSEGGAHMMGNRVQAGARRVLTRQAAPPTASLQLIAQPRVTMPAGSARRGAMPDAALPPRPGPPTDLPHTHSRKLVHIDIPLAISTCPPPPQKKRVNRAHLPHPDMPRSAHAQNDHNTPLEPRLLNLDLYQGRQGNCDHNPSTPELRCSAPTNLDVC
jgi:hypothetical protein